MTEDREHRIRQRAHAIWENHGRPHGADLEHWDQATREIDAEDTAVVKTPSTTASAKPKAARATPAKKSATIKTR